MWKPSQPPTTSLMENIKLYVQLMLRLVMGSGYACSVCPKKKKNSEKQYFKVCFAFWSTGIAIHLNCSPVPFPSNFVLNELKL